METVSRRRREQRIATTLPVRVSGRDQSGNPFTQTAQVVDVSRLGGRIDGIRCLSAPGELIEVRCHGNKAQFRVVWIDDPSGQLGICGLDPGKYIWGVWLPPKASEARAVKAGTASVSPRNGGALSSVTPDPAAAAARTEQRRYPRHRFAGGAQVRRQSGIGKRVWGRYTQISLGGCFIETPEALPVNTKVDLLLGAEAIELRSRGLVVFAQGGRGMGIMFTEMSEEDSERLQALLYDLSHGRIRSTLPDRRFPELQ